MARRMVGSGGEEGEGSMSIVCELFPAAIADMNSVTSGSLLLSPCIYIIHSFSQQKVYKGKKLLNVGPRTQSLPSSISLHYGLFPLFIP